MQVAAVQYDIAWEDKATNHAIIERMLREAEVEPGTFVLLPELGDTGFSFNLDRIVDDVTLEWGRSLARRLGIWLQPGFARRGPEGRGRNCAAIISPRGEVLAIYEKVHPFSYGKESQHYSGGQVLVVRDCGEARVCPLICYDLRFPEVWRVAARHGAEVFTIGASWPDARQAHWRALLIARAIENQAFVVGLNRVGSDPHLTYAGGSIIISPHGQVLAEAGREPAVLRATLKLEMLRDWRKAFPALADARAELLGSFPVDSSIEEESAAESVRPRH